MTGEKVVFINSNRLWNRIYRTDNKDKCDACINEEFWGKLAGMPKICVVLLDGGHTSACMRAGEDKKQPVYKTVWVIHPLGRPAN